MKTLRKILIPFSLIYGAVTAVRNFLYDKGFKKSTGFDIPIIAVGNLSVGGTGKTPMVEYLIRLLSENKKLATLSRGYKRKTQGFYLADEHTKMEEIGDEPFQYHSKFKNISVAVDADRVEGLQKLQQLIPDLEMVVLDDAFQHRRIKAGFYIMLTAYDDLYYKDLVLPAGNLRECRSGVKRSDVVVVTKCPPDLTPEKMQKIKSKIDCGNENIFFSTIQYSPVVTNDKETLLISELDKSFVAVAGIAKPQYFYDYLQCSSQDCLTFPDHYSFTEKDIKNILQKSQGRKIITTEKDYMRLQKLLPENQLFYLPIEMKFLEGKGRFDMLVKNIKKIVCKIEKNNIFSTNLIN